MRHHRFYRHVSSIFFVFSILGGCGGQGRWTKRPKSMTSIVSPIPAPSQNRRATSNQGIGKNWKTSRTIQPWIAKTRDGHWHALSKSFITCSLWEPGSWSNFTKLWRQPWAPDLPHPHLPFLADLQNLNLIHVSPSKAQQVPIQIQTENNIL